MSKKKQTKKPVVKPENSQKLQVSASEEVPGNAISRQKSEIEKQYDLEIELTIKNLYQ